MGFKNQRTLLRGVNFNKICNICLVKLFNIVISPLQKRQKYRFEPIRKCEIYTKCKFRPYKIIEIVISAQKKYQKY